MRTRSQEYSEQVYQQILPLKEAIEAEKDNKTEQKKQAKQYGNLCHNFPLMVLRSGLSQAVAFVWIKTKGKADDDPHKQFLLHLSALTGVENETAEDFQRRINMAELMEYQRLTRKILAASIWYKRFAESMLDAKAGDNEDNIDA